MLITAWIGMYLASPKAIPWSALIFGTVGIACAAAAGAIINHLMDRHIDRKMLRTALRPIASGRISPKQALIFAVILATLGTGLLITFVNPITTFLTWQRIAG